MNFIIYKQEAIGREMCGKMSEASSSILAPVAGGPQVPYLYKAANGCGDSKVTSSCEAISEHV